MVAAPGGENSIPTERGVVIHPRELDAVIEALTEAKNLLASTRAPWGRSVPCPRCQSPEARQVRRTGAVGSLPTDYYCDLCGAVDGPLRPEPPVIDLTDDENHNWLHEVRRRRLEREQREGTTRKDVVGLAGQHMSGEEHPMHTYTLQIGKAIVTVDDEGNWQIVDNPGGHDESLLFLLQGIEIGVYPPPTLPKGAWYAQGAIEKMGARMVSVDPPIESVPGRVY